MAKKYQVTNGVRRVNQLMSWMARRGWGRTVVLTTKGRQTGQPRTVPVSPLTLDGTEFVVAPYGEVAWVHNVRADPNVTLTRGKQARPCLLTEVTGEAAQVVKAYHEREGFARPYMDVPETPSVDDFTEAAASFPVFRVDPV